MLNSNFNQVTANQIEVISVETSTLMDRLGYISTLRQARIDSYRESDRLMSAKAGEMATLVTIGSKAEGLAFFFEDVRDILVFVNNVICLEEGADEITLPKDISVFRLSSSVCYAGHCKLLLEKHDLKILKVFYNALCDDGFGKTLLSSTLFLSEYSTVDREQYHMRAGPSLPHSFTGTYNMEHIVALRCHCPSIMQRWAERHRHWPPQDIVQKVVTLGAFVTPVGFKGSEYHHVEWRICFSMGETELISNLNNALIKVYIMLKMINREMLKPRKKEITSFVLKSIVFWLAEKNSQALFHERALCYWLLKGLGELRTVLITKHLPYYMMPERNLMAACGLEVEQQRSWVSTISDMINEGPRVILRLTSIRKVIISHPEPLLWYNRKRIELELLMLKYMNRRLHCSDESSITDENDFMLKEISRRQSEIVREVVMRMHLEGSFVYDLHDVLFRMLDGSDLS
ncbi:uncharacterized protein LOC127848616 isoform X2 [Dreissena polymorpha]|nr:uncharacterized protein LOC127848616 isoform X2 [Dreissena polymorpha]XP_052237136.1 uncharacterized protein LOC127848616 isoform X2 [Dreissena polymorpha]